MNEPFKNHFSSHVAQWHQLAKDKVVSEEDLIKAMNASNKYTYKEQNDALKKVNKAVLEYSKKDDRPGVLNFAQGLVDATDDMIRDKVISSFRDINKVTEDDIRLKANKIGIPYREFKEQFDLVKQRIDTEEGRKRRAKEVENMKWYDPQKWATSDYEKQRYIDDPNTSLIGKEGKFNPYSKEGQMALSDLLYGGAGAIADFIPGVGGTVVGPAVRGLRDVHHKLTDSKYQKDWGKIGDDVGLDLLFNAGTDLAPTMLLRKGERYAGNAEKGWNGAVGDELKKADDYLKANKEQKTIKESTEQFGKGDWKKQYELAGDPVRWDKAVDRLPESPMKQDLKTVTDAPRRDKLEALTQWEVAADGNKHPYIYIEKSDGEKVLKPYFRTDTRPAVVEHYKKVLKGNDEATGLTKTLAGAADAWKTFGERGVKEGKTATGRGSKPETSDREDIDWFKTNYARDWEAGFVPRGKEDEPIMKAYEEWKAEQRMMQKPSLKDIMGGE